MGIKTFFEKLFGKGKGDAVETHTNGGHKNGNGNGHGAAGSQLSCVDCRKSFIFESGEQKFFKMRGLTPPKRCPNCRSKRKRR